MVRLLVLVILAYGSTEGWAIQQREQLFPTSVATMSDAVAVYFTQKDFVVRQTFLPGGRITIIAGSGENRWEVLVEPHTALASKVRILHPLIGEETPGEVAAFWGALSGRSEEPPRVEGPESVEHQAVIPDVVREKAASVVCIRVLSAGRHIQFSGFVMTGGGLVLCTAHDLRAHEEVRVMFPSGLDYLGEIVKLDLHRDLALIRIQANHGAPIDPGNGDFELTRGESIYTIGCPEPLIGAVYAGVVDSPPRKADGLVLYQASITIKPGSSGSPVFNAAGKLVAMVKGRYRGSEGIGFLIPLTTITDFLHDVVKQ